jgi:hypothetical protein
VAVWDSGFDKLGDTYYTGLDLEIDTLGSTKLIDIYVDGVKVKAAQTLSTSGRQFVHVTLTPGRGHIYRFCATDGNVGLLYTYTWITDPEPGEQTNWNQNYTVAGTLADKWLKGIVLECDTFGQNKTVTVEIDGSVVTTQTVNTTGRKAVHISFPQQLGRVFRLMPTDAFPGRLYSVGWLFDEEPYQLTRYETQERPHGDLYWQVPLFTHLTVKSAGVVSFQVLSYGESGNLIATNTYTIPSTGNVKSTIPVFFNAQKGVLFKYIITCASGFYLYREESYVVIQPWLGGPTQIQHPFGNDDLDPSRGMRNAVTAAKRSGGELAVTG